MFRGKAEFHDPENGKPVASFNETCHDDGHTTATVRFHTPIVLDGTARLEVFGTVTDTPVLSVGASDPDGTEIREFHGTSAIGCIADGADITLVRSPGGTLGTLLIVLGKGTIRRSK